MDEYLEELISRIKLQDGNTEFWKSRFMGESTNGDTEKAIEAEAEDDDDIKALDDEDDDTEEEEHEGKGGEDDSDTEEEEPGAEVEIVEADESPLIGKGNDDIEGGSPELIGSQLLRDWEESFSRKKSSKKLSRVYYPVCMISILSVYFWSDCLALAICLIYIS